MYNNETIQDNMKFNDFINCFHIQRNLNITHLEKERSYLINKYCLVYPKFYIIDLKIKGVESLLTFIYGRVGYTISFSKKQTIYLIPHSLEHHLAYSNNLLDPRFNFTIWINCITNS